MRYRSALLAAVTAAFPLAAQAQPIAGLYIGGGGGVNIMQNETDQSVNGIAAAPGKSLEMDVGATGVGSLGWGFGNGLRAEVEFDYRYNGLDKSINPGRRTERSMDRNRNTAPWPIFYMISMDCLQCSCRISVPALGTSGPT